MAKKNNDVVDLTALQKRGIPIKKDKQEAAQNNDSYVALAPSSPAPAANPLSFLDSLAGADSSSSPPPMSSTSSPDLADLKVQIENFEYKLETLAEKLAMIESKLQEFENKTA